jgi:general stress protein 26
MNNIKVEALNFLKNEHYCVISTVSPENTSESAFVAFSENENLEIMIGTSNKTRKFHNIEHNQFVSVVFGFDQKRSIQYEGKARVLQGNELEQRLKVHFAKHPGATEYKASPDNVYISIEPSWIRLVESGPRVIGELTEFA